MIRPLFASEKLLAGPPYRGCGLSSDFFAQMLATDNEAGQSKFGRQMGQGARRRTLQSGWDAFAHQIPADSNGWVDQGDILLIRRAMWGKDAEQPFIGRLPLNDVWDLIGDYAVSAAIDTGAVGAKNPIRRYVGAVPHQVVWWKKRTINGVRFVKHMCPMHPRSDGYTGHWVKWQDAARCAKAIRDSGGEAFVVLYPIGDWTDANLVRQRKNTVIRQQREALTEANRTIERVRDARDEALAAATELADEVDALNEQLAECRDDKCDAVVEALLDDLNEWVEGRRP